VPWLDITAAALALLTLIVGVVTLRGKALIVTVLGIATAATLVAALSFEGARLQVIVLVILAAVTAAVVIWHRSARRPRLAMATSVILAFSLVGTAGAAWILPPISIPEGSGHYAVGMDTKVWVDRTRDVRGENQQGQERSLPATIWYPAEGGSGEPAAYLPGRERAAELSNGLANLYGIPAFTLDGLSHARSNALWQGKAADGSFPVVIASPGLNSSRWFFTAWAEELASNGVIVIALDHPYDSPVTELADGTWALGKLETTGDDARDQALADHWAGIRAADMRAVIDQLDSDPAGVPALRSADRSHIITAGHSLGGAAALEAARLDDRVEGAVDIDGLPRTPKDATPLTKPVIAIVAGDADPLPEYDAALDALLANGNGTRVTLDGVTHFGMVDLGLIVGPIPGITGTQGPTGPTSAAQATLQFIHALR
jgi:dienelactone hydrolase